MEHEIGFKDGKYIIDGKIISEEEANYELAIEECSGKNNKLKIEIQPETVLRISTSKAKILTLEFTS